MTSGQEKQTQTKGGLMMKYFVLKPAGTDLFARASRKAIRAYASMIAEENEEFANELRAWADSEFQAAIENGMMESFDEK